ncbi:unnamed protein product [Jaminaea pallidilutea]
MSVVHLQAVEILNANAAFAEPYIFKITFECISELQEDIEWKLIYVGSAGDEKYDQELDNCLVGPVPVGTNSFEFEASSPSPALIPASDLLGVTVILLTASYKDQEFIRVGYYVNNEYEDQELRENPPEKVDLTKVRREVLVSKPRVTRFNIKWDTPMAPSSSTTAAEAQPASISSAAAAAPEASAMGSTSGLDSIPGGPSASITQTAAEAAVGAAAAGGSSATPAEELREGEDDDDDDEAGAASRKTGTSSFKPVSVGS